MTTLAVAQPTVVHSTAVDAYGGVLGYCSNTALVKFAGLFWLFMDGSATGYSEGENDQTIWCVTSPDAATWSAPFRPFRDSSRAANPLAIAVNGGTVEWQPGPVVVGSELWVFWTGGVSTYRSRRTATGLWTNERLLWNVSTGAASWSSTSLEGAAPASYSLSPTVAEIADWRLFVACSPLTLSTGTVAVPVTLQSSASVAPDAPVGAPSFVKGQKRNAVLRIADNTSLSAPVALGEWGGNFGSWEPTLMQGADGVLRMFSRNLNMTRGDGEMLLVSSSSDEGVTWAPTRNTFMQVPSSRPFVRQVSSDRWALVHCDNPSGSTLLPSQSISGGRLHGTVFTSRHGVNNFVPGIPFSTGEMIVNYPQILADDNGDLLVNYTVGSGGAVNFRRHAIVARISGVNDADKAYIGVRERRGTSIYPPKNIGGAYVFDGYSRAQGSTALTNPTGVTLWAWVTARQDNNVIIDTRDGAGVGQALTTALLSVSSQNFPLPITPPVGKPAFIAAVVSGTDPHVTLYVGFGGNLTVSTTTSPSLSLDTVAPLFGYKNPTSGLFPLAGRIHRAAIHSGALTAGQIAAAYNTRSASLGQGTAPGATSLPTPAVDFDPANPNLTEFPTLTATQPGSTYSGGILRLTGGVSAGVELPFRRQTLTLKWRLGQTTAATRYPIATIGDLSNLVRIEVDTRDPNYLRVNGARVGGSIDPTTWQTLTIAIEGRRITVGGVTVACGGLARLYLGPAEPPAAIPTADWVEYDVANSVIAAA